MTRSVILYRIISNGIVIPAYVYSVTVVIWYVVVFDKMVVWRHAPQYDSALTIAPYIIFSDIDIVGLHLGEETTFSVVIKLILGEAIVVSTKTTRTAVGEYSISSTSTTIPYSCIVMNLAILYYTVGYRN